jgi:preprotein translocase subunit SecB
MTSEPIASQPLPVTVHAQYLRDVSFEKPNAPASLQSPGPPEMDIAMGMEARKIPAQGAMASAQTAHDDFYEVILSVRAEAKNSQNTLFLVEIQYATLVSLGPSVPEDKRHPLLLIEIPRLAFPFVRQIVADLTVKGGFPPLLLNPVDFAALYRERFSDGKTI